jgi:heat shock protein HtpX
MVGARKISDEEAPGLHNIVAQMAQVSRLPKPRVAIVKSDAPNAFATGRHARNGLGR